MTSLASLIAQLEQAPEGSREFDEIIDEMLHPGMWHNRPYTRSIDSALSLVPAELLFMKLERFSDGWYARVASNSASRGFNGEQIATAPLALCIAALKARSARHDG